MRKNQKYSKEQMFALILKCENSGLSQEKFIKHHGISMSTFGYWRKKYLKETGHDKRKDNFIPVKIDKTTDKPSEVVEVVYPNGVRMLCPADMDLSRLKPLIVL
jgi:transposase-like protein